MYLVQGGVPGLGDGPGPGGCIWAGGYLVRGVSGPRGVVPGLGGYLVMGVSGPRGVGRLEGVPGPGGIGVYLVQGGTWSQEGCWGCTWSRGDIPGPGGLPGRHPCEQNHTRL